MNPACVCELLGAGAVRVSNFEIAFYFPQLGQGFWIAADHRVTDVLQHRGGDVPNFQAPSAYFCLQLPNDRLLESVMVIKEDQGFIRSRCQQKLVGTCKSLRGRGLGQLFVGTARWAPMSSSQTLAATKRASGRCDFHCVWGCEHGSLGT